MILSICIPTYNRAADLRRCLASIVSQWREGVEVLVSDNGSRDETPAVVYEAMRTIPGLRYQRLIANKGQGYNVRSLVQFHATGEYCWILGDDDVAVPGAIARILDTAQNAPGMIQLYNVADIPQSDPLGSRGTPRLARVLKEQDYARFPHLWKPFGMSTYLAYATSIRALLPFFSNVVFPRATFHPWNDGLYNHLQSHWAHLLGAGTKGIVFRDRILVQAMIGRPACRDAETMQWVALDVTTGATLAAKGCTPGDQHAMRAVWALEYPPARITDLHLRCHREPGWPELERRLRALCAGEPA